MLSANPQSRIIDGMLQPGARRRFYNNENHIKRFNEDLGRQETGFNSSAYGNDTVRQVMSVPRAGNALTSIE